MTYDDEGSGNTGIDSENHVFVLCRVRPFVDREIEISHSASTEAVTTPVRSFPRSILSLASPLVVTFHDHTCGYIERERFTFDACVWSVEMDKQAMKYFSQEHVMKLVGEPAIAQSWKGFNTCIFAYGQTGSGKTYTMIGSDEEHGLIPRLVCSLFESMKERAKKDSEHTFEDEKDVVHDYRLEASMYEIYLENVQDLLVSFETPRSMRHHSLYSSFKEVQAEPLKVRHIPGQGCHIQGLSSVVLDNFEVCMNLVRHGTSKRRSAFTRMNAQSSRSHCIFALKLTQICKLLPKNPSEKVRVLEKTSHIHLVDLAGSERNKKSGAEGNQLKEAVAVNKSLTVLRSVIDALVEKRSVVPYRESLLTWILSENLGGNSKTFMAACVSPHFDNADETLNTLRYAVRTRDIVCQPKVNEDDASRQLRRIQMEIESLRKHLSDTAHPELQREREERLNECRLLAHEAYKKQEEVENLEKSVLQIQDMRFAAAFHNAFRELLHKTLRERADVKKNETVHLVAEATHEAKALAGALQRNQSSDSELFFEEKKMKEEVNCKQQRRDAYRKNHHTLDHHTVLLKDRVSKARKFSIKHARRCKVFNQILITALRNEKERLENICSHHNEKLYLYEQQIATTLSEARKDVNETLSYRIRVMQNRLRLAQWRISQLQEEKKALTSTTQQRAQWDTMGTAKLQCHQLRTELIKHWEEQRQLILQQQVQNIVPSIRATADVENSWRSYSNKFMDYMSIAMFELSEERNEVRYSSMRCLRFIHRTWKRQFAQEINMRRMQEDRFDVHSAAIEEFLAHYKRKQFVQYKAHVDNIMMSVQDPYDYGSQEYQDLMDIIRSCLLTDSMTWSNSTANNIPTMLSFSNSMMMEENYCYENVSEERSSEGVWCPQFKKNERSPLGANKSPQNVARSKNEANLPSPESIRRQQHSPLHKRCSYEQLMVQHRGEHSRKIGATNENVRRAIDFGVSPSSKTVKKAPTGIHFAPLKSAKDNSSRRILFSIHKNGSQPSEGDPSHSDLKKTPTQELKAPIKTNLRQLPQRTMRSASFRESKVTAKINSSIKRSISAVQRGNKNILDVERNSTQGLRGAVNPIVH